MRANARINPLREIMHKYILIFILLLGTSIYHSMVFAQVAETYEKALQKYNENEIQEAYIYLKNAIAEDPNHLPTKILMGKTLFAQGLARDALVEFEESLVKGADPNLVATDIAKIHLYLEDYDEVLKVSEQGLDNTNLFELTLVKASTAFNVNDDTEAETFYKKALALNPNNERALQSIAYFYLYTERNELVLPYINKLDELGSNSYKTIHLKGQLAAVNEDPQLALVLFRDAYRLAPQDPLIKRTLANMLINTGELKEAATLIDEIIEQTPEDPFALILSGKLKQTLNDDSALSIFEGLNQKLSTIPSQIKTERSELAFVQGLALYLSGNYEQSTAQLESYILRNKTDINAISVLADTYIQLGNETKAFNLLDKNLSTIKSNLRLSLLLCKLYLNSNKAFKCESLINTLSEEFGDDNPNVIFMRVQSLSARNRHADALAIFEKSFSKQNDPLFVYTAVDLYKANQQYAEALQRIDGLINEQPGLIKALQVKSDLLLGTRDFEGAKSLSEQILSLDPTSFEARKNLSVVYFNLQQYEASQALVDKLLEERKDEFALVILEGRLRFAQNEYEDALNAFSRAKDIDSSSPYPSEFLVQLYKQKGELDTAISELDSLLRQFFLEPKYLLEKANLLIISRKEKEAIRVLNSLFGIWSDDPIQLVSLSQIQRRANDIKGALLSLETAQKLRPESAVINRELALVYLQQGELEQATKTINKLQQEHPKNPSVWLVSGELALANGKNEQAFTYFSRASDLDASYQVAVAKMYQLALNGTQVAVFKSKLDSLINQVPSNMFYKNLMADFKLGTGDFKTALSLYEQIVEQNNYPNMAMVLNNVANIYLTNLNDKVNAEKYAEQAFSINNDSPEILDTLGWIKSKNGDYQEALTLLRQAFAKRSSDLYIRYHLAYTLFKLDRLSEANRELNYVLSANDNSFDMQKARELKAQIEQASAQSI